MLGEYVLLFLDGAPIAASTECNLDVDQEMIEVCSPVDGRARSFIPGTYGWTAGNTSFVATTTDAKMVLDAIRTGRKFTMTFLYGSMILEGDCYLKSSGFSGKIMTLCTLPVTIQGSGELRDYTGLPIYYNGVLYTGYNVDVQEQARMSPITDGGEVDADENLRYE